MVALSPDLHEALGDYAAFYEESYGAAEPLNALIPAMLAAFIESDRAFVRRRGKTRGRLSLKVGSDTDQSGVEP